MVYDDDCGFCKNVALRISAMNPSKLRSVGSFDKFLESTHVTPEDVRLQAYLFSGKNILEIGSGAIILSLVEVLHPAWRFLLALNKKPLRLAANGVYRVVAKYRMLFSKSCRI